MSDAAAITLTAAHRRRLREVWRSAGWPFQDLIEAELLAAGLLERCPAGQGPETVRVTDVGVAVIADTLRINRSRLSAHEALVGRVVRELQRGGRLVWRGLRLRAGLPVEGGSGEADPTAERALRWCHVIPDVFSIRRTSVESYLEPEVHEIKVNRSDLLGDLQRPDKGAAYRALSGRCWYVLRDGIAEPDEVPAAYGVMVATADRLQVLRAAPPRAAKPDFGTWMALAQASPEPTLDDDAQAAL